jgi:hypothetical protein
MTAHAMAKEVGALGGRDMRRKVEAGESALFDLMIAASVSVHFVTSRSGHDESTESCREGPIRRHRVPSFGWEDAPSPSFAAATPRRPHMRRPPGRELDDGVVLARTRRSRSRSPPPRPEGLPARRGSTRRAYSVTTLRVAIAVTWTASGKPGSGVDSGSPSRLDRPDESRSDAAGEVPVEVLHHAGGFAPPCREILDVALARAVWSALERRRGSHETVPFR